MSFHVTHASHKKTRKSGTEMKVACPGGKRKNTIRAINGSKKRMWHMFTFD